MKYTHWHWHYARFVSEEFLQSEEATHWFDGPETLEPFYSKIDFESEIAKAHKDGWNAHKRQTEDTVDEFVKKL